ncbi:DNA starvation/stationary phase protection protein, partial [Lactiplantibacillus plantarum]|nr:DNA starvation/stationary phase protection protein [Lactiplantibacillus plantarum]
MKYTKNKAVLNQLVADLIKMSMIINNTKRYMR